MAKTDTPPEKYLIRQRKGELVGVTFTFHGRRQESAGVVEKSTVEHVWMGGRKFRRVDGEQVGKGDPVWSLHPPPRPQARDDKPSRA